METANVNGFSSTTQVDGRVALKRGKATYLHRKTLRRTQVRTLEEVSQSATRHACIKTSIRQNGTGKYTMHSDESASLLRTDWLYSSAWSCRTGKRMESSFVSDWSQTHQRGITSLKDQPSSGFSLEEKRKSPTKMLNKSLEQGLNLSGS